MDVITLLGKTLAKCEQIGNEEIRFETVDFAPLKENGQPDRWA